MSLQLPEEPVEWSTRLVARVMARHRLLFVVATVILSVAASRVANDPKDVGSWLVVMGSACFMYLADSYRELEEIANGLVAPGMPLNVTRHDVVRARAGTRHTFALLFGTMTIVLGILLPLGTQIMPAAETRTPAPATARPAPAVVTRSPTISTPSPSASATASASPGR